MMSLISTLPEILTTIIARNSKETLERIQSWSRVKTPSSIKIMIEPNVSHPGPYVFEPERSEGQKDIGRMHARGSATAPPSEARVSEGQRQVFKYYSAVYNDLTFQWCEKGLEMNKSIVYYNTDGKAKRRLADGIGYFAMDNTEDLLFGSLG
ncbi:hypothetical protein PS15p_204652 [Mucor circinelloides]